MAEISDSYQCGDCGTWHDDLDDARECCPPETRKGWKCTGCGDYHYQEKAALQCCPNQFQCAECGELHQSEVEATDCCGVNYVYHATPAELEAAGQRRLAL